MATKYILSNCNKQNAILQQVKRHSRCMGTLAYQYLNRQNENVAEQPVWSNKLSFASPESDFVGMSFPRDPTVKKVEWSQSLSFASPEADFTAEKVSAASDDKINRPNSLDTDLLVTSPESAFGSIHMAELLAESARAELLASKGLQYRPVRTSMQFQEFFDNMSLMTSPESASGVVSSIEMMDDESKAMYLRLQARMTEIPTTLTDAMSDPRPIVVTALEPPFNVVDVNDAWVGLCGYQREEALNQHLGKLLQGPETNLHTARDMISQLRREHSANAVLTNYTKDGRKFRNRVRAGILSDEQGNAQYFVGVLEEMYDYEAGKMSM
jgi:PAS domain S-box-containing protein